MVIVTTFVESDIFSSGQRSGTLVEGLLVLVGFYLALLARARPRPARLSVLLVRYIGLIGARLPSLNETKNMFDHNFPSAATLLFTNEERDLTSHT